MQNLAGPLAVYVHTVACDRCGLDATLYSDGLIGHAFMESDMTDLTSGLARDGVKITAACRNYDDRSGETCDGQYVWDLSERGAWEATTTLHLDTLRHATTMDVA